MKKLYILFIFLVVGSNLYAQNLDPLWAIWKFEHGMDFEEYTNTSGDINYYVTWASASSVGWDHEIYSKTVSFNTNGNLQVLVNDHIAIGGWEAQEPVASTMNPSNNYILSVFEDGGQSNIPNEAVNISVELHKPDGTVIKPYFQVADGPGAQHSPAAGHLGNRFLAFYGEDHNVSSTQMKVAVLDDVTGNVTQTIAITPANEYHWWGVYASNNAEDVGLAAWVKDTELVAGSIITESGGVVSTTPYQVYLTGAEFVYNRVIWLENINRFALITKAVNGQGAASDVTFIALIDENGNKTQEAQIQGGIIQEGEPAAQWDPNTQSYIFVYPTGTNNLNIVKINNSEITYHSTIIGNNNTFLNGITWKNTGIMSKFIKDENGNQVWSNQYIALFAMGNFDTHEAHLLPIRIDTDIFGYTGQTPYGGVAWAVPGKIEAENYDNGGEAVAYHDLTAGNSGNIYRTDGVDMEVCSDTGGGYNIAATEDTEWLEYTVNVASSGIYTFSIRIATAWGGTKFKIFSNGIDLTGVVDVTNTGGWQTWQTVSIAPINLSAGQQVLKFEIISGGFNLNNIDISLNSTPGSSGQSGVTANAVTSNWYNVNMAGGFSQAPILIAGMQTFDGSDAAGLRIKNLTSTAFNIMVEEERSRDSEIAHTTEVIGYIAFEEGILKNNAGTIIGEAGKITNNQASGATWYTVSLTNNYSNPVVIMEMNTFNGADPTHIRLRNVNASSFQYQMEEWDYKDGAHTTEKMSYMVIESGIHTFSNSIKLVAGKTSTNQNWITKSYGTTFSSTPVVVSQPQTYNEASAIVTRQKGIGTTSFQVRVQEEEGNNGSHATETIGFFAIQSGSVAGRFASSNQPEKQEGKEKERVNKYNVQIYPNPAQDKFFINTGITSGVNSVKIYNLLGELVADTQLQDGEAINISMYKKGIYLVNINNTITKRLVKE